MDFYDCLKIINNLYGLQIIGFLQAHAIEYVYPSLARDYHVPQDDEIKHLSLIVKVCSSNIAMQ